MATTTSFTSLSVPAPDDTMEMSSPAIRHLDDDIDIDFEDDPGGIHVTDDERMLEEGETRPATGTDDMMEDDVAAIAEEAVMHDDFVHQEDEELIDYGEDDFQDQPIEDADADFLNVADEPTEIADANVDQAFEELPAESEPIPAGVADAAEHVFEDTAPESKQRAELAVVVEEPEIGAVPAEDEVHAQTADELADQLHTHEDAHEDAHDQHAEQPYTDTEAAHPHVPPPVDTSVSAAADTPGTPTDTGLHATNVRYGDMHMPLFKSKRQPDGLLNNDNLASLSLAELIRNCRQRLALKIGEDVSEDQELVLGFDSLGLMLVEDSRAAFESSLNEVLEVYLQLHRNDDVVEIPPLSLNFTLQLKFSSSFAILKQAASGGQGMSNFGFLHAGDEEQYYNDGEFGEGEEYTGPQEEVTGEEGLEDQEYHKPAYTDNLGDAGHTEGYHGQDEDTYGHEAEDQEYYEDQGEYHEEAAEEPDAEDYEKPAKGRADNFHSDQESADALYNALEDPKATGQAEAVDAVQATNGETESASSTTVQGDQANDQADPEVDDEFSTFLTELDAEDAERTNEREEVSKKRPTVSFQQDTGPTGDAEAQDAENQEFEDFLNDPDEDEHDQGQVSFGEGEFQPLEGGEESYEQADTFNKQQDEEYYHGDQPGEDGDDQFHTAHDFSDGEHYEQGPEHNIYGGDEEGLDDTTNTVLVHPVDDAEYPEEDFLEEDSGDEVGFYGEAAEPAEQANDQAQKPVGKRSLDDLGDLEDLEDEPEAKKARAV